MQGMQVVATSLDDDAEQVRDEFHMFIAHLGEAMNKRSEQEELNIMNARWRQQSRVISLISVPLAVKQSVPVSAF